MWKLILDLLDPETKYSFGRWMSLICTAFVLLWDTTHVVFMCHFNYHLPPGVGVQPILPDATVLLAQGGFMTLFYGVTKLSDVSTQNTTIKAASVTAVATANGGATVPLDNAAGST